MADSLFTRRSLAGLPLMAALAVGTSSAGAQSYPSGTIRIVVPAAAGSPPGVISHIVATEISQSEGWRVVVENKPGAMQTLAAGEVLRLPADGHTVMSTSLPGMSAPALLPNVKFSLAEDFAPVIKLSTSYNVLVVHPSVPVHSVAELVALAKKEPDTLTFSSGGFGTPAHLIGELFKVKTGIRTTHVPYQQLPRGQTARAGGDCVNEDTGAEGRADGRGSRIPRSRRAGLVRLSGEEGNTGRGRRCPQRRRQQGAR